MPTNISIVVRDDLADDVEELDLTADYILARDGYIQTVAGRDDRTVDESAVFHASDGLDALGLTLKRLEEYLKDDTVLYALWWRVESDLDGGPRQALIRDLRFGQARVDDVFARHEGTLRDFQIGVTRSAIWESDAYRTFVTGSLEEPGLSDSIEHLGGMRPMVHEDGVDAGEDTVAGDTPARIAQIEIRGVSGGEEATRVWGGWRSGGTFDTVDPANFVPAWDFALGLVDSGAGASVDTDSEARSGERVSVDFTGAEAMDSRVALPVENVTANPEDQRGRYLVLLRARTSDGVNTTTRVRLLDGYRNSRNTGLRVQVSVGEWTLFEMGEVEIPTPARAVRHASITDPISLYELRLEAERISGTGDLYLDCLILIPVNEAWFFVDNTEVHLTVNGSPPPTSWINPALIAQRADGRVEAVQVFQDRILKYVPARVSGRVPLGESWMIVAAQTDPGDSGVDGRVMVKTRFYESWRVVRT